MGSTPVTAATVDAASRGGFPLVRLPFAPRAAMLCVLAMFPASMQIAPEAT
jgi:hypothetical protein